MSMKSMRNNHTKRIFIGGMCSLPLGTMERQLGNMAIFIPTIEYLKKYCVGTEIVTSLQLTQEFCGKHGIQSLNIPSLYKPKISSGIVTLIDLIRTSLWKFIKNTFKYEISWFIRSEKIKQLLLADLFIDFSGDTYGDIAYWGHFLKHSLDLLTIRNLNIPVYIFAQSNGPFTSFWRKELARFVLNKTTIITSREPIANGNIKQLGIKTPIFSLACPSWLFDIQENENIIDFLSENEKFKVDEKLLVGFNITGFNFARDLTGDNKYLEKRSKCDIQPVIDFLHQLIEKNNLSILIFSHVFRLDNHGAMISGPDGAISKQIYNQFIQRYPKYQTKINIIKNPYDAPTMKTIIGLTEICISGRLHAGVAAMSQLIPTVLLAYSPKHYGFSRLMGIENLVVDYIGAKFDGEKVLSKFDYALKNREKIKNIMGKNLALIREKALINFEIANDILNLEPEERLSLKQNLVSKWNKRIQLINK